MLRAIIPENLLLLYDPGEVDAVVGACYCLGIYSLRIYICIQVGNNSGKTHRMYVKTSSET